MKNTKICIHCGIEFPRPKWISKKNWAIRKFCSKKCHYENGLEQLICPICGKEFKVWKYQKRIYCSSLCKNRSRPDRGGKIILTCKVCGKVFTPKAGGTLGRQAKYCSHKCKGIAMSKENHPMWKGGIAEKHRPATKEYKDWRISVYKRDWFKCQDCGNHCKKDIIAHHLKSWKDYPKLRFEITNGITLCRKCHKIRHKEIGLKTRFRN
ncbi:MAG: HNH endonuclease [Candidatus Heimdallarchaeaceae archaeon]